MAELAVRSEAVPKALYLLEVEVVNVSWTHHPLCSSEHVATRRVLSLYQEYSARMQAGLGCRLAHKLQALRNARDNAHKIGDSNGYIRLATISYVYMH